MVYRKGRGLRGPALSFEKKLFYSLSALSASCVRLLRQLAVLYRNMHNLPVAGACHRNGIPFA